MEKIKILYEDSHLIVCVKPAGVPVQTRQLGIPDLESLLKNHLNQGSPSRASQPYLAVIHRLDQPVRGILVFAKTPAAAKNLNRQLQSDQFTKTYRALLCGTLPAGRGTLTDYLVKDGRTNTSRVCGKNTPGAKKAELDYRVLSAPPQDEHPQNRAPQDQAPQIQASQIQAQVISEVEIHLKTGRHHQIRVQMAKAGAPLLYDNKYNPLYAATGSGSPDRRDYHPIALCACELSFTHPKTGKTMQFKIDCDW